MGCSSCGTEGGKPNGCKSNGGCSSSSCNKMNTYDWLSDYDFHDPMSFKMVEVSFKEGSSKGFYHNDNPSIHTGDMVAVEGDRGYNIGEVTLSGELVRLQIKKKEQKEDQITAKVLRLATEKDIQKLNEARDLEIQTLVRSRVIARNLGLEMKIGDVEYQADKRKATFFYTAEGRIDFRTLVRQYSDEFKIKVEMRQIGARQESARIGGLGSCGRELCCSTWLTKFKSVSTTAARYQNLSINQTKLSGQCGRLKCCLNYELDTYLDILKDFPKKVDYLKTKYGKAQLIKMDIFKGIMFYNFVKKGEKRGVMVSLPKERVQEIKNLNKEGELPDQLLSDKVILQNKTEDEKEISFADVTGQIELPADKKRSRNSRKNKRSNNKRAQNNSNTKKKTNSNNNPNRAKKKPNTKVAPKSNNNKAQNKNKDNNSNTKKSPNQTKSTNKSKKPNTQNKTPRKNSKELNQNKNKIQSKSNNQSKPNPNNNKDKKPNNNK